MEGIKTEELVLQHLGEQALQLSWTKVELALVVSE